MHVVPLMACDSDEALDQGHRASWLIIQALRSCAKGQRRRPSCRDHRRSPGRAHQHLALGLAALERLKEPNSRSQVPAECTRRPLKLAERRCAAKPGGGLCFCSFRYENQHNHVPTPCSPTCKETRTVHTLFTHHGTIPLSREWNHPRFRQ